MLAKWSVKKPFTVGVGVVILFILGVVAFMHMTPDLLPNIDLPFMMVSTTYPGASPEKVEGAVTKPLEQALATTSGLESITSVSNENMSMIMLTFNQDINMDSAMIDVNGKIDQVKGNFEEGILAPMIIKMNPNMMPIMMLSIDIEGRGIEEVSRIVKEKVIPMFERIPGVAAVSPVGLIEENLSVQLNEAKIQDLNKRILATVDEALLQQQQTLEDAQKELNTLQGELSSQKETQLEQLEKAQEELQKGKEQLQVAIDTMGLNKEQLEEKMAEANDVETKIQAQLAVLEAALSKLPADDPQYLVVYKQIVQLQEQLKQVEEGMALAKQGLQAIEQLATLQSKEEDLIKAKAMIEKEFVAAEGQMGQGVGQLASALDQLEGAKKVAYEKAGIEELVTLDMLATLLKAENFAMPAGYVKEGEVKYSVKVGDKFNTVQEVEDLVLFVAEGIGEVKVRDIADVRLSSNAKEMYTNINGNPGVILTFQRASAYATAAVTKTIREQIDVLAQEDDEMTLTVLGDQGVYIDMIIDSVMNNLIYGGILAVLVLWLFLRSFKTTLVVAFSIPISVLFAIVLMYFSGVTLNIISLSGLALGVGMLVDNSIVVIENIYRLRHEGLSKKEAAVEGTRQVAGAIFASTLTTVCVFVPIVFTSGITKQLFVDMALTIGYSLGASLIVALTVVPAMSAYLVSRVETKEGSFFRHLVAGYESVLKKSLQHKAIVLVLAVVLLGYCAYEATQMGTCFMPTMDSPQMTVTLEGEQQITKQQLYEMSNELIERLLTIDAIQTVGALESSSMGKKSAEKNEMMFYIILKEDRSVSNGEVEEVIYEKTADLDATIRVKASAMDVSALAGTGIEVHIKGSELDTLTQLANEVSGVVSAVEGTMDVSSSIEDAQQEVRIVVDKNKAMTYNLTVAQVYQMVSQAIKKEAKLTSVTLDNKDYPVIVTTGAYLTKDALENYMFKVTKGTDTETIKLADIASLQMAESLNAIQHDQQVRYVTVAASIDSQHNIGLVSRELEAKLKEVELPEGYTIEVTGENQTIKDAMKDLIGMLVLAVLFVYLIMVAQFQSLLSPLIVMFTIPLAFTGGLLALLLTRSEISVIAMLGFLVLAGVVVNNGIVFVDYVNQLRSKGVAKREALIETGRTRIRPILMTALTTILAMSTMAIGVGMGAEITQGLAIVTIGGLLYGTVLTLVVIPVLYDLFNRKEVI